ncbi:MAG: hypothetical protein EOO14_11060 [Chitinophagaceae bacterium]|nr:MAG: hypothetical protein EOO14_11060 [Chitinophagaceae bacterium]
MKNKLLYSVCLLALVLLWGCKKEDENYPGGTPSPYIAVLDVRAIHEGQDVTLTKENMFGASKIAAVVTSDHSGGNIPAGLVVVQDNRRLGELRGLAINLGAAAADYMPGDGLIIDVEGGTLSRVNGILQLNGISTQKIEKAASGIALTPLSVKSNDVIANPGRYEGVLITLTSVGFDPSYPAGSTYAGDRTINDGFGNTILHTETGADWSGKPLPFLSNFSGIVFSGADGAPQLWPRTESDITVRSATAPKISPVVVSGFLTDPAGGDGNYEYIQFLATRNIDFSVTPMSVVTTNNAGASTPTGVPVEGWATGDLRTYKIDITDGTVQKGQYFYVGANKKIWGSASAEISPALWVTKMYNDNNGDGFGTKTSNLLANSGNAGGIAVFDKTAVDATTVPVDVVFFGGNGSLFSAGPPSRGYRITNTDYFDEKHPVTQAEQPFFAQGSNTTKFTFPTVVSGVGGYFAKLGGVYNIVTGRWTSARLMNNVLLNNASTLAEIEGGTSIED